MRPRGTGPKWISSQFLLTSIPTLESVLVIRSGISLPCIRDMFPIICSGRKPRGGWTSLPHSPCDSGINGPIHPRPGRRPPARSHLSSSVNETLQAIYKGFDRAHFRLRSSGATARLALTSPNSGGRTLPDPNDPLPGSQAKSGRGRLGLAQDAFAFWVVEGGQRGAGGGSFPGDFDVVGPGFDPGVCHAFVTADISHA